MSRSTIILTCQEELGFGKSSLDIHFVKLKLLFYIYLRRVPSLFLPSGQSSSTAESEAITSSHSLPGRGVAFSNRLNITVARFLNYFSEQNLKLTLIFFVVMHLFYEIL